MLVPWLSAKLDGMLGMDAFEQTRRSAQMTSILVLHLTDRRLARRRLGRDRMQFAPGWKKSPLPKKSTYLVKAKKTYAPGGVWVRDIGDR